MASAEITIREENLEEPDIQWGIWFLVLFAGFITGAVADLFVLWLFAHWINR